MSKKNNNNKFSNRAARRFNDINKPIDAMSQEEIFDIWDSDIKTVLDQVTAYREKRPGSPYPAYVANAFANLSTSLWFYEYVKSHVKVKKGEIKSDLDEADLESLRTIISDAYKKSATGFYEKEMQEAVERAELLSKAFIRLWPKQYRLTAKLEGLTKPERRDLVIQVYGDPTHNMKFIHKLFNRSSASDKTKLKVLKKMYGKKRFVEAVGAAMTVEGNNSDCLAMLYDFMMGLKKKKRAKYIRAYAEAYKKVKVTRYFRIDQAFYDSNKRIIRELGDVDIGYRKAFKDLKGARKNHKATGQLAPTYTFRDPRKDFKPSNKPARK